MTYATIYATEGGTYTETSVCVSGEHKETFLDGIAKIIMRNAHGDCFRIVFDGKELSVPYAHPVHGLKDECMNIAKLRTKAWEVTDASEQWEAKKNAVEIARELIEEHLGL